MAKKIVFDSQPLISFLLGEVNATRVQDLISQVEKGHCEGYINIVNLIELRYILARAGRDLAEQSLTGSGIRIVSLAVGDGIWQVAAELKASYAISLADACAAGTAIVMDCQLVVDSDPELEPLGGSGLVKMLRM